jgi:hypothetical protein
MWTPLSRQLPAKFKAMSALDVGLPFFSRLLRQSQALIFQNISELEFLMSATNT